MDKLEHLICHRELPVDIANDTEAIDAGTRARVAHGEIIYVMGGSQGIIASLEVTQMQIIQLGGL